MQCRNCTRLSATQNRMGKVFPLLPQNMKIDEILYSPLSRAAETARHIRIVHSYFFDMGNKEFAAHGIKNCEVVEYCF